MISVSSPATWPISSSATRSNFRSGTMGPPPDHCARSFRFERDTFTFANELVWQYRFDPASGAMTVSPNETPPVYTHRCFVIVRSSRQFFYHAPFAPGRHSVDAATYRRRVRPGGGDHADSAARPPPRAAARPPGGGAAEGGRVVTPGWGALRAFSQAH